MANSAHQDQLASSGLKSVKINILKYYHTHGCLGNTVLLWDPSNSVIKRLLCINIFGVKKKCVSEIICVKMVYKLGFALKWL